MLSRVFFQFFLKYGKSAATIIAVILLFSLFGYWKFEKALTNPEMCLTNSGDGIGGIGNIFNLKQATDEEGLGVLFTDTFPSKKNGFGLAAPNPMSVTWKWDLWTLSHFFSPENVYDINAFLAFVLIGLFGFILLRELGVSIFFSMIGAVMLTHMDHFFARLHGHLLGLGTYYFPLLLCWAAVRAGKRSTMPRLIIFAACTVLNFQVNEYYGFYGVFFSFLLFLGYYLIYGRENLLKMRKLVPRLLIACLFFVGLMCLFYPSLMLPKIFPFFFQKQHAASVMHNEAHGWYDFLFYSVRKPFSLFSSSLPWIRNAVDGVPFRSDLGEFTFRIGLVIPLFIVGALCFFGCRPLVGNHVDVKGPILECAVWLLGIVLMVFFALNPQEFVSLVPFTYKIAPMFRVAARAFLYVDIAMIVLSVYLADRIVRVSVGKFRGGNIGTCALNAALILFVFICLFVGVADVTGDRVMKKAQALQLPDTKIYEALKGKPEGLVLELPMYSPITHPPERNYIYRYNRSKHGFGMVNASYPPPSNSEFREVLHRLSINFNALSQKVVSDWQRTGVRYVVVDKAKIKDSQLRNSKHLKLIADTKAKSIFEMQVDENFARDDFLETFIYSEPSFSFSGTFQRPNRNDKTYWIWCGKSGEIILKNHSRYDKKVVFQATFVARQGSTFRITTPFSRDTIQIIKNSVKFSKIIDMKSNTSLIINIASDADPYNPSNPAGVFCMYEYEARTLSADKASSD